MQAKIKALNDAAVFQRRESDVRGYCRSFPAVFTSAKGALLRDESGRTYIDFLCGAGSLNYGHNPDEIKNALLAYLESDGIVHSLDLHTRAKRDFLDTFESLVLTPRNLDYKMQFCGPTGTNAVEAAFKLARRVTGRTGIVSFTNGFHGVTLGALAATGNRYFREAASVQLGNVTFMPYDGWLGPEIDTIAIFERYLSDRSSGLDLPAAAIVETMQGEGGLNVASDGWLRRLADCCARHGVLLIVDDIQVGCGRTGTFFSFERAGITPDMVLLAKSLSGYGLPLAVVLMKPEHDRWRPAEHNGTFRGPNLAFVAATVALRRWWSDQTLSETVRMHATILRQSLRAIRDAHPQAGLSLRGRGMAQGLACRVPALADAVSRQAYERGLIIETAGAEGQVIKCLPPLVMPEALLREALAILADSVAAAVAESASVEGVA